MTELTPAMKQYVEIKKDYPSSLLLFRMGDFYESFFDDAKELSQILGITLTKRGTNPPVPLAGIPFHSLDNYLQKLVKAQKIVTIIEQIEDPKLAKGRIVKRAVTRTVSPGTVIEANFLDSKSNNYICSIHYGKVVGVAYTDISTGEFKVFETTKDDLINDLIKISPSEILISDAQLDLFEDVKKSIKTKLSEQSSIYYNYEFAVQEIKEHFNVLSLKSFEIDSKTEVVGAIGALLNYLKYTQKMRLKHINTIQDHTKKNYMILDIHTIKNLELVENLDGSKSDTVIETIDFTSTPMGARLLRKNLLMPLNSIEKINKRLDYVESLINNGAYKDIQKNLVGFPDLERIISRIVYGSAGPRELVALKESVYKSSQLFDYVNLLKINDFNYLIDTQTKELADLLNKALQEDSPLQYKDGGFIKSGFSDDLDQLLSIRHDSKKLILQIEEEERKRSGIKTLKVGYNRVFGYFIEIPKSQASNVPLNYVRKQTIAQNERYITEELKNLEDKILTSEEKSIQLELEIFNLLVEKVKQNSEKYYQLSNIISQIDFHNSLALNAIKRNYVRPQINDKKDIFISEGYHCVVESKIKEQFVKNDLVMGDDASLIILTGPNMAGKSTYLRQNALILILAHMGSYVPSKSASIPLTDRIFTRIGAHDNLALGLSTFMVEMIETANILNNATSSSFIILDEIGRGTSTYDGLSIAFSVAEYIYKKIGAKTIFATHYHQLTQLENKFANIKNYHLTAKEFGNDLIFLRKVNPGSVDKSYGIAVARLAGLPKDVIERAKEIESELDNNISEKKNVEKINTKESVQRKLF